MVVQIAFKGRRSRAHSHRAEHVRPVSETENPEVDVRIPVSGRTGFVAGAVEAVLAQTYAAWNLVVSVDGSESGEIRERVLPYLQDPRISLTATGERVGAAGHMSRLVAAGNAPYVAILHDDDLWEPTFLECRVAFLQQHPTCGFVFSPVRVIDGAGDEIERQPVKFSAGIQSSSEMIERLLTENVVPAPSVVVRRATYQAVGGAFEPTLKRIYDYELWLRLAITAPVGFLATHDASWRWHADQSTRSVADRQDDFRTLLHLAETHLAKSPHPNLTRQRANRSLATWSLTNALDAAEQRAIRVSLANVAVALKAHPASILDPRVPILLLTLPLGHRGIKALNSLRTEIRRRALSVHPIRKLRDRRAN